MVAIYQLLAVSALSLAAVGTASTDALMGYKTFACNKFASINWDDVKYTCSWEHKQQSTFFNNIYVRYKNGVIDHECFCKHGLDTYDPWGSQWTRSTDKELTCYNREGILATAARSKFDSAPGCGELVLQQIGSHKRALQTNETAQN